MVAFNRCWTFYLFFLSWYLHRTSITVSIFNIRLLLYFVLHVLCCCKFLNSPIYGFFSKWVHSITIGMHDIFCLLSSIWLHVITNIWRFSQVRSMRYWTWYSWLLFMWSASCFWMLSLMEIWIWNYDHWHYVYCCYLLCSWCRAIYNTKYSYSIIHNDISSWIFTRFSLVLSAWRLVESTCAAFFSKIICALWNIRHWNNSLFNKISRKIFSRFHFIEENRRLCWLFFSFIRLFWFFIRKSSNLAYFFIRCIHLVVSKWCWFIALSS